MQYQKSEKREVLVGLDRLPAMTKNAAKKWGERNMPRDLKAAGFTTTVFESDAELHGGSWYRINYGKASAVRSVSRLM